MLKIEKEYQELYGDIPKDDFERLMLLINQSKIKKPITEMIHNILNIKWKQVGFILYLVPKATPRPRSNFKRNIFYVSGSADNKNIFRKFMKELNHDMIYTAVKFKCITFLPIPKAMHPVEKILAEMGLLRPISKPDFDNLAKTYADMITDTLLYDDSIIIDATIKKYYSTKPRIEINIEYMEEFDSKYNQDKYLKKKEGK